VKPITVPFFISHQGCPHTCVFCDQRTISGAGGSLPTAAEMLSKIAEWRATAGGRSLEVAYFGGSFTALPREVQAELLAPLQQLLARGEVAAVRLSTRPDYIDDDRVNWLKKSGVRTIELGVQSMDDAVLAASGRGHAAAQSEAAMACIKRHGLLVGAQLMPGLPGDTPHSSLASLERVIAAGADFVRIYPALVIRGTELARRYAAGDYVPLDLEFGISLCKLLLHRALQAGLPVIRIGLQADDGLNETTVLAGCRHPSLGQVVRSRLYSDLIGRYVSVGENVTILCHSARLSDVLGQKKSNLKDLAERGVRVRVLPEPSLEKNELVIIKGSERFTYNLLTDLEYSIDEV
jgi:histone acetyltransferase (RNA polymerase elongator complex component)